MDIFGLLPLLYLKEVLKRLWIGGVAPIAILQRKSDLTVTDTTVLTGDYLHHIHIRISALLHIKYVGMAIRAVKPLGMGLMRIDHIRRSGLELGSRDINIHIYNHHLAGTVKCGLWLDRAVPDGLYPVDLIAEPVLWKIF